MNLEPDPTHENRKHAERLTRAGKFVVLCEDEICCPVTDGFIRAETHIFKVCDTLAEAEAIVSPDNEGEGIWIYRLPEPKPAQPESSVPDWDDEVPF